MLWSLKNILKVFFLPDERTHFVEMQRLTGLVIAGSRAGSFFTDNIFEGADLDVLVQFERREPVFEFMEEAGYQYMPRVAQTHYLGELRDEGDAALTIAPTISFSSGDGYEGQTIIGVLDFLRPGVKDKIQVILTRGTPVYCILQFHSSKCALGRERNKLM